ncbi:MAG TPA: SAM-dependent methyltransferase [Gammaproteobacteria bacterium]|nr:SAM-dependent methyltransferase [Gammaproteobacteria bacterium]
MRMIEIEPIGHVRAARMEAQDDFWGGAQSRIELEPHFDASALDGIDAFSHVEVLFHFHLADPARIETRARHPRNNLAWPKVGIFAQRGKNRPNRLGTSIVKLLRREPRALVVLELDAIDGTPVVDLKPVMAEFLPREPVRQPDWSRELMRDYWAMNR